MIEECSYALVIVNFKAHLNIKFVSLRKIQLFKCVVFYIF
uniref:Uncharacterized protein n=2 Tax=Lepeophtheirus salmonis TaxID=72036 RepID=A0A0K2UE53_LEPSM